MDKPQHNQQAPIKTNKAKRNPSKAAKQHKSNMSLQTPKRDELVAKVLAKAKELYPIGNKPSTDYYKKERINLVQMCHDLKTYSDPKPAQTQPKGDYKIIYADSDGPESGRITPTRFYGTITQSFSEEEPEEYINTKTLFLGFKLEIRCRRGKIHDDQTVDVKLYQIRIKWFGLTLFVKTMDLNSGQWKYLFMGTIQDGDVKKSVRILEGPMVFIMEQVLEDN